MEKLLSERAAAVDSEFCEETLSTSDFSNIAFHYQTFARALRDIVPLWNTAAARSNALLDNSFTSSTDLYSSKETLVQWLYTKCLELQKQPDDALALAVTIVSTFSQEYNDENHSNGVEIQAALFDILGESEDSTDLLFQLVPLSKHFYRYQVLPEDLFIYTSTTPLQNQDTATQHNVQRNIDLESLRLQALAKAQQAAILKAQVEQFQGHSSSTTSSTTLGTDMTHTLYNKNREKTLVKEYKRVAKEAAHALQKARQQGAIFDDDPILCAISSSTDLKTSTEEAIIQQEQLWRSALGGRGLGSLMAQNRLLDMTSQLLPENSRVYYAPKSLPMGTTREIKDEVEIVTIPPPSSSVYAATSIRYPRLVITDIMNSVEAKAFEGTSTLNPMQSAVFSTAFHTRENMLICAPTGAGKTNVAMLAVVAHLRNVGILVAPPPPPRAASSSTHSKKEEEEKDIYSVYQHIGTSTASSTATPPTTTLNSSSSSGPGRKIVYIAPMKALAQEVVAKFSSKLSKLKIVVQEFTGDMQLSRAEAERSDILVTTPEKWDVITRKGGSDGTLAQSCGLLLLDEVHILADEGRGAVIESIVARLHRLIESSQRHVRIVALSATLPNYKDVAEFLRVDHSKGLYYFGPEFRPVPLLQKFIGVNPSSKLTTTTATSAKQVVLPAPTLTESLDSEQSVNSKAIVKPFNRRDAMDTKMNEICYEHVVDSLRRGYQVMVFVHSRKGTGETARYLADAARKKMELGRYFLPHGNDMDDTIDHKKPSSASSSTYNRYYDRVQKSRNREVSQHFANGIGIHHAGMLRVDRKLTEDMFADGAIRVLCCTATLAWGVNLPAHTVVIKGTEVYNPEKGGNNDLSILDVMQIFGRAGRPQFDDSGEAILITTHDAFTRYLDKLIREVPIESSFIKQLADHLNAEIAAGTVSNIAEGVEWLRYTYLYVRMIRNPLAYGITADMKMDDPSLSIKITQLIKDAAKLLDNYRMARYDPASGNFSITNLGRIASQFYLNIETIHTYKDLLEECDTKIFSAADLCQMVCRAHEFGNVKVRPEELDELDKLSKDDCPLNVKAPREDSSGKCCVLLQAYISNAKVESFTLTSDLNYVTSNAGRIARALFEMFMKKGKADAAVKLLRIAKSIDRRLWWFDTPLRQFETELPTKVYVALENWADHSRRNRKADTSSFDAVMALLDMQPDEVGQLCHWFKGGERVKHFVEMLPRLNISCIVQPITRGILRFQVVLAPCWKWNPRWHGSVQAFWLFVEDSDHNTIYHHEHVMFQRRTHPEPLEIEITIPAFEPLPSQYFIRLVSDIWVGVEMVEPISFKHLLLPTMSMPFTDLLDLIPLPISALGDSTYEQIYQRRFKQFNPIQTQLFHILYHSDCPVLLGAPTGSGKTTIAEIAIMRMKKLNPKAKCVCIAPLKSLARERLREWKERFGGPPLRWNVLELSGDTHHDSYTMNRADILVSTPEKWDLVSRGWRKADTNDGSISDNSRSFVKDVRLLIIDEIHLLGEERGAVLEAIVSRTRFISKFIAQNNNGLSSARESTRIIGLSTSIANPFDLADWIGIRTDPLDSESMKGLYNFRASVRPVPMIVHISGFSGRHFCSRMASMNKPAYTAIKLHSPNKPVIIFVASRRQTRLTALDLVSYASNDGNPRAFLHCDDDYIDTIASTISDGSLRHTICYGIGLHHAGLSSHDRETVERMFLNGDVQILVATATLAWGVNLPAHLVIVKGTEYFDAKTSRYIDYPVTDVLQMMGRAGRPQFDTEGISCVFVEETKKNFYKKFLYLPFPLESHLSTRLADNINAEVAIGTISTVADAIGYLSWTFYSRRVKVNPSYYGASSTKAEDIDAFFISAMRETLTKLVNEGCIEIDGEDIGKFESHAAISPSVLGRTASSFYLSYKTPLQMRKSIVSLKETILPLMNQLRVSSSNEREMESDGQPFTLPNEVETFAVSAVLYHLAHLHEFDELPVRHNEEFLNLDLSKKLPWGHDLAFTKGRSSTTNSESLIDLMKDPHTKCYLLLQAFISKSQLPISDYDNDTRSVIEQIPRLLAATEYIFQNEFSAYPGGFSMAIIFPTTRQIINSQTMPGRTNVSPNIVYARDLRMTTSCDKTSGKEMVKVDFNLHLDRNRLNRITVPNQELSISIFVGTSKDVLKCHKTEILPIPGFKSKSVSLSFDYRVEDKSRDKIIVRLICENLRTGAVDYSLSFE